MIPKNDDPVIIDDEEIDLRDFYALVEAENDEGKAVIDVPLSVIEAAKRAAGEGSDEESREGYQGTVHEPPHEPRFKEFATDIDNEPPLFKPEPVPVAKKPEKKAPVSVDDLRALLHGDQAPLRIEPETVQMADREPMLQAPIPQVEAVHVAAPVNPAPVVEMPRIKETVANSASLPELEARLVESFVTETPVEEKSAVETQKSTSLADAAVCNKTHSDEPVSQPSATPCTFPDCPYVKAMQAELERHGKSGILGKFFSK